MLLNLAMRACTVCEYPMAERSGCEASCLFAVSFSLPSFSFCCTIVVTFNSFVEFGFSLSSCSSCPSFVSRFGPLLTSRSSDCSVRELEDAEGEDDAEDCAEGSDMEEVTGGRGAGRKAAVIAGEGAGATAVDTGADADKFDLEEW